MVPQKLPVKLLEMGKDMKIKYSVSYFFSWDLFFDVLIKGLFLDLSVNGPDSWRSELRCYFKN